MRHPAVALGALLLGILLPCFPALAEDALGSVLRNHDPSQDTQGDGKKEPVRAAPRPASAAARSTGTVRVNTRLNVRGQPWGEIIGSLRNGDQVKITAREGEWYKIDWNGRTAYVHSNYITTDGAVGASGATGSSGGTGGVAGGTGASGASGQQAGTTGSVPPVSTPAPGASGGRALLGYLQQAGLTGETLRLAWAIGMGESGGDPRAHNQNRRTGDNSYGLFQINMIDNLGPARRREFGLSSNDQLFDPATNIRAMMRISSNGTNWRPWGAYTNGSYRPFYNQFPPR